MDCFRRKFVSDGAFFYPNSILDPVMRGQRSNFRKIDNYSNLHWDIYKKLQSSDMKLSPAYASFIFVQMKCLYRLLMEYVWRITFRKWTASPSPAISPEGKLGQWPWLTWGSVTGTINMSMWKLATDSLSGPQETPQNAKLATISHVWGQRRSVISGDLWKDKMQCHRSDMVWSCADLNNA